MERCHASVVRSGSAGLRVVTIALMGGVACGEVGEPPAAGDTGITAPTPPTDTYATSPCRNYVGPTLIDIVDRPGCPDGGTWSYGVDTIGWTNGEAVVNAWEAASTGAPWNEEHVVSTVAYGPCNSWDRLEVDLASGVGREAQVAGQSTAYDCAVHGAGGHNAYAVRVYDFDGNYTDCVVFSDVPGAAQQVLSGEVEAPNPVSSPDQLNAVDCEIREMPP